jgi:deoxyribodipyrimidine photo-lyase
MAAVRRAQSTIRPMKSNQLDLPRFEPTVSAALARLAAIRPGEYARTRNHLGGAVSQVSPYLTHGFVSMPEVARFLDSRHQLDLQHKFAYELGWREYFQHVWRHEGEGILESLHEGPLPDAAYASELPADIREARTGVPTIDAAVRMLYACGWLHNHARMWLASYVVHLRKVHWRAGADWMLGHLLDGDLASNHLSWQWVAGTGSHKPYLFNADNVARFAPKALAAWSAKGTVLDQGYEAIEQIARSPAPVAGTPLQQGVTEPPLHAAPPDALVAQLAQLGKTIAAPKPKAATGREVWLVPPWCLRDLPEKVAPSTLKVGLLLSDFHSRFPWSEARWRFVLTRMARLCDELWLVDAAKLKTALAKSPRVRGQASPHLAPWLQQLPAHWELEAPPLLLGEPGERCASFSQFWANRTEGLRRLTELPGLGGGGRGHDDDEAYADNEADEAEDDDA